MRSAAPLLLLVLMALMGLASANNVVAQHNGLHRAAWVRNVQGGNSASASATSVPTTTTTTAGSKPTGTIYNGDRCTASKDCVSGNCFKGKCADPLTLGETGCYKDAGCTTGKCAKGRCVPQDGAGLVGDRCNASDQCASGNCSRSHCAEQVDAGEKCYKNSNCASGNCVNDKCVDNESVANGDKCNRSQQCTTGNYCRHSACSPMRDVGGPCYKDQGCISGICDAKRCVASY